jgi:hypothetical protein
MKTSSLVRLSLLWLWCSGLLGGAIAMLRSLAAREASVGAEAPVSGKSVKQVEAENPESRWKWLIPANKRGIAEVNSS